MTQVDHTIHLMGVYRREGGGGGGDERAGQECTVTCEKKRNSFEK